MFYTHKVLFVHAPRTGGDWLTHWAYHNLSASVDRHHLKHLNRPDLIRAVPELAGLVAFTVVRDEGDRHRSFYTSARVWQPDDPPTHTADWQAVADDAVRLPPGEWVSLYSRPNSYFAGAGVLTFPYEDNLVSCVRWLTETHGLPADRPPASRRPGI